MIKNNKYNDPTRESDIEKYLRDEVKKLGGKAYKFVSPGNRGVPDRIVLIPKGIVIFIELKAPGKTPTPIQIKQQTDIKKLGFAVDVIDSKEGVDEFISIVKEYQREKANEIHTT